MNFSPITKLVLQVGGVSESCVVSFSAVVSCFGSYPTVGAKPARIKIMKAKTSPKTISFLKIGCLAPYSAHRRLPSLNCALI